MEADVWYLETRNSSTISDSALGSSSFLNFSNVLVIDLGIGPVFSNADWFRLSERQFFIRKLKMSSYLYQF